MFQKIKESADYIASKTNISPAIGIVLGSGLGAFEAEVDITSKIPFSAIPHFPLAGVDGHSGSLLIGMLEKVPVIIMQGRVHYYEGYTMDEVTFPIRVLKQLGVDTLLLTNAAGGLNPKFAIGDLMIITDHINLMPNPLIGVNHEELGPRFPDMSNSYNNELIQNAISIATDMNIRLYKGVYIGVTGPTYETPAEYKYLRVIGGDAVGMSTVPEVIVARHMDISCFAISVITDLGIPDQVEFLTHEMVQKVAANSEPLLTKILRALIAGQ